MFFLFDYIFCRKNTNIQKQCVKKLILTSNKAVLEAWVIVNRTLLQKNHCLILTNILDIASLLLIQQCPKKRIFLDNLYFYFFVCFRLIFLVPYLVFYSLNRNLYVIQRVWLVFVTIYTITGISGIARYVYITIKYK